MKAPHTKTHHNPLPFVDNTAHVLGISGGKDSGPGTALVTVNISPNIATLIGDAEE